MMKTNSKNTIKATGMLLLWLMVPAFGLAQLAGNYTIDPNSSGSRNYKSISAALADLSSKGVSDSVLFDIADGTYYENIEIKSSINGMAYNKPVTFRSANANAQKVKLVTSNANVIYTNAPYFVFSHLGLYTDFQTGVNVMIANTHHVEVNHCIIGNTGNFKTAYGIYVYSSNYCNISNNNISHLSTGIYCYAKGATYLYGNSITYNRLVACSDHQIYMSGNKSFTVSHNVCKGSYAVAPKLGIYLSGVQNGVCEANKILGHSGGLLIYGANLFQNSDSLLVLNNLVNVRGKTEALQVYRSINVNIYHNTFATRQMAEAIRIENNENINILNNYFWADSCSYGFYLSRDTNLVAGKFDYNNFAFQNCDSFGYYNVACDSFRHFLQADTLANLHSTAVFDALVLKNENCTPTQNINNKGIYVGINKDIEGNKRPFPNDRGTDVGCYEFKLDSLSLAIYALKSPQSPKLGNNKVICQLLNNGQYDLLNKKLRIGFSNDGGSSWTYDSLNLKVLQTGDTSSFSFKTPLQITTAQDQEIIILIDDWPTNTSGVSQAKKTFNLCFGLQGSYQIGTNGDFKTIAEAIDALQCGVARQVVFNIENGTYTEALTINHIKGASVRRQIIFQAKDRKNPKVVLSNAQFPNIILNQTAYLVFKNLTIKNYNTAAKSTNIKVNEKTHNIHFDSCAFYNTKYNSSLAFDIQSSDSITISNSLLSQVFCALRASGRPKELSTGLFLRNNVFLHTFQAINLSYYHNIDFQSNQFDSTLQDSSYHIYSAHYITNSNKINFDRNKINTTGQALALYYAVHQAGERSIISNNEIISNFGCALYLYTTDSVTVVHNTILSRHTDVGLGCTNAAGHKWLNNIIKIDNADIGCEWQFNNQSLFDYNTIYATSCSKPIIYSGIGYYTVEAFQKTGIANTHGFVANPHFNNHSPLLFHSSTINNSGAKTALKTDIKGNQRPNPADGGIDPGCYELVMQKHDLKIIKLISPLVASDTNRVKVAFENTGTDTFINSKILVSYSTDSGKTSISDTLSLQKLAPGDTIHFTFSKKWLAAYNGDFEIIIKTIEALTAEELAPSEKTYSLCSGIKGKFTIGPTGHFKSIGAAVKALKCGITGPVHFILQDGTYYERISIGKIKGASAQHNITFSGSKKALINYPGTGSSDKFAIILSGANYVTIRGITISATGAYAAGVLIKDNAQHNRLTNLSIQLPLKPLKDNIGLLFSNQIDANFGDFNGSYNRIDSNIFNGGAYGIYCAGAYKYGVYANIISKNIFTNQYVNSIYLDGDDSTQVLHNQIGDSSNFANDGIVMVNASNASILANKIFAKSPLSLSGCSGTNLLANNQIIQEGSFGVALNLYNSNRTKLVHNSILAKNALIACYYSDSLWIENNIIASPYGLPVYQVYDCTFSHWNYNDYYLPKSSLFSRIDATTQANVLQFATATSPFNQVNYTDNPKFAGSYNLHLSKASPPMAGQYCGVDVDIDNDKRCTITPMLGCDENQVINTTPVAAFNAADTLYRNYINTIKNTGKITGSEIVSWYVNDSLVSHAINLHYKPMSGGWHKLKLVHTTCSASDSMMDSFFVARSQFPPIAAFYSPRRVYAAGENILLFDTSAHQPVAFTWSVSPLQNRQYNPGYFDRNFYWNAKKDSFTQNPALNIYYTGKYTVCLKASNKHGSDSICKKDYLEVREILTMCQTNSSSNTFGRLYDSGGDEYPYVAGQNCYFTIEPCKGTIALQLSEFKLAANDYLKIYDGPNTNGKPLWNTNDYPNGLDMTANGTLPVLKNAKTGIASVYLISDYAATTADGFALDWEIINDSMTKPQARFIIPDTICTQRVVIAQNESDNAIEYAWDVDHKGTFDVKGFMPAFKFDSTGWHSVSLVAKTSCRLTDTFTQQLFVDSMLKLTKTDFSLSRCFVEMDDTITLTDESNSCREFSEWQLGPGAAYIINTYPYLLNYEAIVQGSGFYDISLFKKIDTIPVDSIKKAQCLYAGNYCTPKRAMGISLGINSVEFAGKSYHSKANNNYKYYGYKPFNVLKGNKYKLNLSFNSPDAKSVEIYIDFNGDYDFDDKGELVFFSPQHDSDKISVYLTVPQNSITGSTRMRISTCSLLKLNGACNTKGYGEVEDYPLQIGTLKSGYPELRLSGNLRDTINLGDFYTESGFIALDPQDGNISHLVKKSGSVDNTVAGTYTLSYIVTDSDKHTSTQKRYIVVGNKVKPQIKLIKGDTIYTNLNLPFNDPGIIVTDDNDPNPKITKTGAVDTSKFGIYLLRYCATDSSGNKTCTRRWVIVTDSLAPQIYLYGPDTAFIQVYDNNYVDSGYYYFDNDSANVQVISTGSWAGKTNELSTYSLIYRAIDRKNNIADARRTIIVGDSVAPTVKLLGAHKITVERWSNYIDTGISYFDNFYNATQLKVAKGGSFVNTQSTGNFTISYRVSDPSGNVSRLYTRQIAVVQTSSLDELALRNVALYPNPTSGNCLLQAPQFVGKSYSIYNSCGQLVAQGTITQNPSTIETNGLPAAVYLLKFENLQIRLIKVD
ncbi:DUF5011 domain-containing protein [bacterium]|nr:DUF5011 domain-containing protein [bacterium]